MNLMKRNEGKRDFLLGLISKKVQQGYLFSQIADMLNIPSHEMNEVYAQVRAWEKEQLEREYGIAEIVFFLIDQNPEYIVHEYIDIFISSLGISKEEFEYFKNLIESN